ncbi:protachykinin-1-like isoform X1 [Arapaima gigas]
METWKLLALIALLLAVVYCARGASESGDTDYLSADTWQLEPAEENFGDQVADLLKRSKSQQFYGLMGRRSGNRTRSGPPAFGIFCTRKYIKPAS